MSNLSPSSDSLTPVPIPGALPHSQSHPQNEHGRGRGRSRGGLGKYLRARGRRGYGRPAEFTQRLAPGDDIDDEEAKQIEAENAKKYARRQLTSNADRYDEPEPELGSDGEPIVEPEVDLSAFLQKQKLSDDTQALFNKEDIDDVNDDDIDHSIAGLVTSNTSRTTTQKKGKVTQAEWTPEIDAIHREKLAADAVRDLKERFRAKADKLRTKPVLPTRKKADSTLIEAPPLPLEQPSKPKDPMEEMEAFLDELLQ